MKGQRNEEKSAKALEKKLKPRKLFYLGESDMSFGDESYIECKLLNASKAVVPSKELLEKFGFDESMQLACDTVVDMTNPIKYKLRRLLPILENGNGIIFEPKDEFVTNVLPRVEIVGEKIRVYPEGIVRCAAVSFKYKERARVPGKRDKNIRTTELYCGMPTGSKE